MRFMLLYYPGPGFGKPFDEAEDPDGDQELGAFSQRLSDAGKFLSADGFHPSSQGAFADFRTQNQKPVVSYGPFLESACFLSGYWLIEADSLEEAVRAGV